MSNIIKKPDDVPAEVISHDVAPLTVNTDARAYTRLGWLIVLGGVVGGLLWASLAPLDKGVPMSGFVAKEGNRKAIQYLTGGTVQDILVQDGDVVKAGQVLVKMSDVQANSALEITLAQYFAARTTEARLKTELSGGHTVALPASLQQYKSDPRVQSGMVLQQQLLSSRQLAVQSELGAMEENMAGLQAQMQGLEESRNSKKEQQVFLKEQLDSARDLAAQGYVPRSRLLDLERTYSQVAGSISEDVGNIARARRQVSELKLRSVQRSQEYQKEVRTQLAEAQKEAEALFSRIAAQQFELANVEVRAPVDGIVVGSSIFTKGGVVAPGARMMDLVPINDALVVEGNLPVNLVDRVHPGLKVELIFSAFNSNKTPHIQGEVIQVAADRTVEERTGAAYYKVRARVTPAGAKMMAEKKLDVVPGMPVEMFVTTGERTMMSYLLKPVFDRAKSALTEE
ncbi:membrane fusion protein, protease secretion system [Duganella sp. CF402]|uniref:HlyD family type I secretion periplasmic adaptor subunit n=1 Tax=unclassified Duganella TaxID=2636909 RepID=UPI0008C679C0|nr:MULTISPECIES: HlyD family type I secretion periplasmic adaptor subunit [unclassified Duganella]RZT08693.1 protease secretion system membrane fusion protein [Duganella sp. BK701]SEL85171.1 membrane fusion protein, protease secretion system [Duganella sp. CF402]